MRKNNIVAVIPIKKKICKNKKIKIFYHFLDQKSLLEVKILQLKKVKKN